MYFSADDRRTGRELWSSDETPGGTLLLKDLLGGRRDSAPAEFTPLYVGGRPCVLFAADGDGLGRELRDGRWSRPGQEHPLSRVVH